MLSHSLVKETETSNDNDDVTRVVKKVVAEVRNIPLPKEYDLSSFRHGQVIQDTSPTLLKLISSLVSKEGEVTKPALTLAQCIQQHISASWNQTTLGLAVKLHHKYGSKELVKTLNEHGIVTSYEEVLRFRKSAAKYVSEDPSKYLQLAGLEKQVGPIHSWGDNFDLVVFTPNGRRTTHAMATQFVQNPSGILFTGGANPGSGIMSLKLPRLNKIEAGKLCLADKSGFLFEHYTGPRKISPPKLAEVPRTLAVQNSIKDSVSRAQTRDATWLCQLHSSPLPLDWSAYNAVQDRGSDDSDTKL